MSIFEPHWPPMSERMRRDLEAGGKENFRAIFVNPDGYSPVPHGKLGTCWKCAEFDKKESPDYGMWLFRPDDNENIYYCERDELEMAVRWHESDERREPHIDRERAGPDIDIDR